MTTPSTHPVVPKARVRDSVIRRVDYRLDPDVARDTLLTTGHHQVEFAPERLIIRYDQDDLVATEGHWTVTVEASGPRIRRDGTYGEQIRSCTFHDGDELPTYAAVLVRSFHPDNPAAFVAVQGAKG